MIAPLFVAGTAVAQTGRITGTVTSAADGRPVTGAQVVVQGTTVGGISGDDGRYAMSIVPGTYRLRVTRIGFSADSATNVVVTAGGTTTADFRMTPSAAVLTGMVVIGYGEAEARDVTGSVDVVSSEEFAQGRVVSAQELIQSKVAGVQVVDNNEPGGGISIRIRGASSVTASSEPLYVVDGVPLASGGGISTDPKRNPLSFINPGDIESITVLKDASATAIYGSRGSNGVVIIRTKGGAEGRRIEFASTISQSRVTGGPDLIGPEQYRALIQDWAPGKVATLPGASTDWRDAIERDGVGREQNVAVSGGREEMNYRLSLNYLDQSGVVQGTELRRASTAISYQDRFLDRFDISASLKGSRQDDAFTPGSVIGDATALPPVNPIFNDDGSFYQSPNNLDPGNPIATLASVQDRGTTYRSVGHLETRYDFPFLTGLSGTLNLGYDYASSRHTVFTPRGLRGGTGSFSRWDPSGLNKLLDLYGTYTRSFDQFASQVNLTGGYSYEDSRVETPFIGASNIASNLLGPNGVPSAQLVSPSLYIDESRLVSFFGRANWTLMDRYLTTLSVRRDGSSKFGPNSQWGVFPAAAFAWRLSEEPFMQDRTGPFNDLKVRLSWGLNGNQGFGNYQAVSSYTIGDAGVSAQFGNEFVTTIRPSAVDPNLQWEQTASTNVGLDFGILDNRIAGTIDWYSKETEDLIFRVPVAGGTNVGDFVTTNIGSMKNRGIELGLNAQVLGSGWRGFTWTANFNAARNTNELTKINRGGTDRIEVGGISGGVGNNVQILQPGLPVNTFFVYKQRYADGKPVFSDDPLEMYEDLNGDGTINTQDKRPYENPAPKWILGHTSNITYGNFDANFTLRANLGNHVYNNVASNFGNFERITAGATNSLHESVLATQFESPQYWSDYYVEDASFLRMDNITVGYTFHNLRQVNALRIFGTIQNAFTMTGYDGVDPTAGVNGIDNNLYPRSRTFLTGANIQF